jgi:integral membrane sensor domain MASE1
MAPVAVSGTFRQRGVVVVQILVVAAAYYGSAKLGLLQQLVRGQVTPLWPPTGIALVGLLLFGLRVWPGVALGALLINAPAGPSAWAVICIVAGDTLAPVCSYALLRRAGFRTDLQRLRDAMALIVPGALAGTLVSSTVGSAVLVAAGALPGRRFWSTWSVWWTGDAMGVLAVTPLLLVAYHASRPRAVPVIRWLEAAVLLAGTGLVTYLATSVSGFSLLFLPFPFLIWAAFRFHLLGATPCTLVVVVIAVVEAARETGQFSHHTLFTNMITLQAFNGTTALTALLLAVVVRQRNQTHREIERLCTRLSGLLAQLDPEELGGLRLRPGDPRDDGG